MPFGKISDTGIHGAYEGQPTAPGLPPGLEPLGILVRLDQAKRDRAQLLRLVRPELVDQCVQILVIGRCGHASSVRCRPSGSQ